MSGDDNNSDMGLVELFDGVTLTADPSDDAPGEVPRVETSEPKRGKRPRREPGDEPDRTASDIVQYTDIQRAARFVRLYCDQLVFHPINGWYAWNGNHWQREGAESLAGKYSMQLAVSLAEEIATDPEIKKDETRGSLLAAVMSAGGVSSVVRLAANSMLVSKDWVDTSNPLLLNCKNGTLDLTTGELRAPHPGDRLLHCARVSYDPTATCPQFDGFLELTQPDPEMRAFLQRLAGYALTGEVRDQVFPVMCGDGGNGKSTLFTVLADMMGTDLAIPVGGKMLTVRKGEQHETEMARLYGKRLVISQETAQNAVLDEARVKELTGGDQLSARFMNKDHFMWTPTHKLVMVTNHVPRVTGTDRGIWRRILIVRWNVNIKARLRELHGEGAEEDTSFGKKLIAESSGILNWALAGCIEWQRNGLNPPASVYESTSQLKGASDTVGVFIKEMCTVKPAVQMRAKELYSAFERWCSEYGTAVISQTAFGKELANRGFGKVKSSGGNYRYLGIEVTPKPEAGDEEES